jgi:hypothetical protein
MKNHINGNNNIPERMAELMKPIDCQIMMCDDNDEVMMLACAMLQRTREIFDQQLGIGGRKAMFAPLTK